MKTIEAKMIQKLVLCWETGYWFTTFMFEVPSRPQQSYVTGYNKHHYFIRRHD